MDIEFTLNFFKDEAYKINIVQCRPLGVETTGGTVRPPENIDACDIVLQSSGAVIGKSVAMEVDWLIYVMPDVYAGLQDRDRYAVARRIDELTHHERLRQGNIMLIGPGRWGTTTPSLGIPVVFMDISRATVLCEVVTMHENLVPDASLGTHFFNDLVEHNMVYLALFPGQPGHLLNRAFLEDGAGDCFEDLLDRTEASDRAVHVIHVPSLPGPTRLRLHANTLEHRVICYREQKNRS